VPLHTNCYEYELDFSDLQKLSVFTIKTKTKKITTLQNKILQFIGTNYHISGANLFKKFSFKKEAIDYSNAKKYLRKLSSLGLVEVDKERTNDHISNKRKEKYYKLSNQGIYTLVVSNENLPYDVIKNIITNHDDHILFRFFVFPYIKPKTLLKITDSVIFSRIFSYLHECCRKIDDLTYAIRHTYNQKDGYLTDQLFIWDNVPKEEYDTEILRSFLKERFKWDWLQRARFKKTEDNRGIEVSYGNFTIQGQKAG
jgi:DNA-binding PadR family transcriptional regulator